MKAGRKKLPKEKKKITVIIYPRQEQVDAAGGLVVAKQLALSSIVNAPQNK